MSAREKATRKAAIHAAAMSTDRPSAERRPPIRTSIADRIRFSGPGPSPNVTRSRPRTMSAPARGASSELLIPSANTRPVWAANHAYHHDISGSAARSTSPAARATRLVGLLERDRGDEWRSQEREARLFGQIRPREQHAGQDPSAHEPGFDRGHRDGQVCQRQRGLGYVEPCRSGEPEQADPGGERRRGKDRGQRAEAPRHASGQGAARRPRRRR